MVRFHLCVSRRSLQLTLAWFVCVGWVGLLFSVGELNFDLFLTSSNNSSNNLTATVESNAATERTSACRQDGFLPFDLACSQVNRNDRFTVTKVMRRCSTSMTNWDLGVSVLKVWKFRCIQGRVDVSGCIYKN